MSDYKALVNKLNSDKEISESNNGDHTGNQSTSNLNNQLPPQKKHFNVLHPDGSLADLPDQEVEGGGALEGTIGQ